MPRRLREHSGTGIYHVMLRGINRQKKLGSGRNENNWNNYVQKDDGKKLE